MAQFDPYGGHPHAHPSFLRTLLAGALGAAVVLLIIRHREKLKPFLVAALKELHSFKEWLLANVEGARQDLEDWSAEAKHAYEQDLARDLDILEREKALLQKLSEMLKHKEDAARA
ncbi:MAG: hypothetical protein HYZ28_25340 [Myxococcales bacterium]|nr:hypothetical protein [Myxococcales bacterium]